jgi:integrase
VIAVIRYEGARGAVWRIKFRDAGGRQVMQTLGREADGWTRKKAERALGARLVEVDKTRWRKPNKVTFAEFAARFATEAIPARRLKPSTVQDYSIMLRRHLVPFFGSLELARVEPEDIDRFVSAKMAAGSSPKTIRNCLGLLSLAFKTARRWRLVTGNPVEDATLPRPEQTEMRALSPPEVARLLSAYQQLEQAPSPPTTAEEWRQVRRLVTLALSTGVRRGEALALRWSAIKLLEERLTVRETYSRGRFGPPKSRKSLRTIDLGPAAIAALSEQWEATRYRTDSDLVFCHPLLGTPLQPSDLTKRCLRPALAAAGIEGTTSFHCLRHTALTAAAATGLGPHYVQALAGHSSVAMAEHYVHAATNMFPGAATATEARLFAGLTTNEPD